MKILSKINANFDKLVSPIILLGICMVAFGLQIYWLGYTLDDWIILYSYHTGGLNGLMEYSFMGSRPLIFWAWYLGFELLGTSPVNWQIWTIFWRFISVLIFWIIIRKIWPQNSLRNLFIALLFAIYPVFFQQPSAITFSFHWICFSLYLISIYLMIKAVSHEGNFFVLSGLSILLGAISLFSQEFFVGLELLRGLIIWIFLDNKEVSFWNKSKKVILNWLPYLLMFVGYVVWRFYLMPLPGTDRNSPQLINLFLESPLRGAIQFLEVAIRDMINILFGVWYHSYKPEIVAFQPISILMSWVLAGIVFLGLYLLVFKIIKDKYENESTSLVGPSLIIFGVIATILGLLPGWIIGRGISDPSGLYNDRFGLAAMPGVSILLVGFIFWIVNKKKFQFVILCLLVALAIGQHFRSTSEYRWSWEEQKRLFWQLKWRIPEIQPPVAFYGDGALIKFMGSWATVSALNLMYPEERESELESYWYFDLTKTRLSPMVENDVSVHDRKNNLYFSANAKDSIIIQSEALPYQCVWIVDSSDIDNPFLTPEGRYALPLSNFEKISNLSSSSLDMEIFGSEINHDWCYYYQKAELSYQFKDWNKIIELWNEADSYGYKPYSGPELIPFIEASMRIENWDLALELTQKATFATEGMNEYLCSIWKKVSEDMSETTGFGDAINQTKDQYGCTF